MILGAALCEPLLLLSVVVVSIAMVLSFLSVGFRLWLENWRYFGVKLFRTGWDTTGLYEQNRLPVINTNVLFYT